MAGPQIGRRSSKEAGLAYLAVWSIIYQRPEDAAWVDADERAKILNERNARPVVAGQRLGTAADEVPVDGTDDRADE